MGTKWDGPCDSRFSAWRHFSHLSAGRGSQIKPCGSTELRKQGLELGVTKGGCHLRSRVPERRELCWERVPERRGLCWEREFQKGGGYAERESSREEGLRWEFLHIYLVVPWSVWLYMYKVKFHKRTISGGAVSRRNLRIYRGLRIIWVPYNQSGNAGFIETPEELCLNSGANLVLK